MELLEISSRFTTRRGGSRAFEVWVVKANLTGADDVNRFFCEIFASLM